MPADDGRDRLVARINDELSGRLVTLPKPPEGFRPLEATAGELERYGFARKPHGERGLAIWKKIVAPPRMFFDGLVSIASLDLPGYRIGVGLLTGGGHQETSANWSGAVIVAEDGWPFSQVLGQWRVPTVSRPAGADPNVQYGCSTWIGIDGHAAISLAMPQVGTTQTILADGTPHYEAWYQWWVRDHPFAPVPIPDLEVEADEVVACAIDVLNPTLVRFSLTNVSKGIAIALDISAPQIEVTVPPIIRTFPVDGHTAEWIAERPTMPDSTELYPLPDFNRVTFEETAVETVSPTRIRGLSPSRLIRMTERHQYHTEVLSRAKLDDLYPPRELYVGPGVERDMGG